MMVRTSMDVDTYNISIHGWANNGYRTTSPLPSDFHDTILAQVPMQSRLPDRLQTPKECTMPSSKGVPGVGHFKGDELTPSLSACAGRRSQGCSFGQKWKATATQWFGLTSFQLWFPFLKLVVMY
jgi:hypothetical protein